MIRLVFIILVVGCIAFFSPTRESADLAQRADATLGGIGAIASSPAGRRILEEAVRGEIAARADALARAAEGPAGPPSPSRPSR